MSNVDGIFSSQVGVQIDLRTPEPLTASTELTANIAALSGTGFLIGLMTIYLLSLIDPENPQAGLAAMYLLLFLWSLAVDGHIYRHALSIKMSLGVLVAVLIFAANFILMRAVFG